MKIKISKLFFLEIKNKQWNLYNIKIFRTYLIRDGSAEIVENISYLIVKSLIPNIITDMLLLTMVPILESKNK